MAIEIDSITVAETSLNRRNIYLSFFCHGLETQQIINLGLRQIYESKSDKQYL
jgi:hypothetical protein